MTKLLKFSPIHPQLTPEVSQGSCGDGWEERPGTDTCYSFIDNDNVPPLEAEELCKSKGGHLVSINSQEEKDYLSGEGQFFSAYTKYIISRVNGKYVYLLYN